MFTSWLKVFKGLKQPLCEQNPSKYILDWCKYQSPTCTSADWIIWVFLQTENKRQSWKAPIIRISILNLQDLFSCSKVDWSKECKTEVRTGKLETIRLKIVRNPWLSLDGYIWTFQNRSRRHLSSMKKYLKSILRNSAELGFVENCTIGFCCCQTKNERTSCNNNYFLQGKWSVEGDQVRAWACHRWNWKATQVFENMPKN